MKNAKTESGEGGGGIAGSMKQMFGGRAGKGKTGCASSDESPLGAGHLRRSKELGSAVVQKFSLLLYHFMEERGITLSTLFRLIDQADVPLHATEMDNDDDDEGIGIYEDGYSAGGSTLLQQMRASRKPKSAFGHTRKIASVSVYVVVLSFLPSFPPSFLPSFLLTCPIRSDSCC